MTNGQRKLLKNIDINELNQLFCVFLLRFFIGYWILKTGLDFYPGPIFLSIIPGMKMLIHQHRLLQSYYFC